MRYHLLTSLHPLNYFHFCFHCYHLVFLSSTSYIIIAFTLASEHHGLEINILYYCILYNKVHKSNGQHIKKQRHYFANKSPYNQSYGFPSSHVWVWELDHREGWAPKNWCFATVVLEKPLESPLDTKEVKPVSPKGNQPWIFTGRTDAEAEALILWPSDVKNWITGKDPDVEKDWRQEEKGMTKEVDDVEKDWRQEGKGMTKDETKNTRSQMTKDEMVGWHCRLNGHEFEQTLGDGEGQESQVCCSPWGHTKSQIWLTEQQQHKSRTTCRGCTHVTIYARHMN